MHSQNGKTLKRMVFPGDCSGRVISNISVIDFKIGSFSSTTLWSYVADRMTEEANLEYVRMEHQKLDEVCQVTSGSGHGSTPVSVPDS